MGGYGSLRYAEGGVWEKAAAEAARTLRVPIETHVVGGGPELGDPDGRFPAAYGITSAGAVLVRPDGIIAWRSPGEAGLAELEGALRTYGPRLSGRCAGIVRSSGEVRMRPSGPEWARRGDASTGTGTNWPWRRTGSIPDRLYPGPARAGSTRLLTRDGWTATPWTLATPLDLREVRLGWVEDVPAPAVTGREPEAAALLPDGAGAYPDALGALARPRLFEDRTCYRLLEVAWPELTFTRVRRPGQGGARRGLFQVMPVGVFQPAHESPGEQRGPGRRPRPVRRGDRAAVRPRRADAGGGCGRAGPRMAAPRGSALVTRAPSPPAEEADGDDGVPVCVAEDGQPAEVSAPAPPTIGSVTVLFVVSRNSCAPGAGRMVYS
ncbi:hypothetical protein [Microbispora sp. H11081]|uniref:aromatic-ring hydroxylase C-terminal domain-containing protein n=1 Tax=Microbispora sp. H11081 TaxID=2729107 RepID=UPI001475CD94|nr:hypothetical protein [Microbispora sp. H11081]